jgi:hypothetical protein
MADTTEKKIDFLYSAISDAQELIKFIDTKTAVAITIIGSIIVGLFTTLETTLKYFCFYSCWFHFLFYLLIILLVLCIWVTTRIIKPTNNPKDNLQIDPTKVFKLKFFIPVNKYRFGFPFYNSDKHKLDEKFNDYSTSISSLTEPEIIDILTLELFKVSYIRNIKNDRFNYLLTFLILTTVIFFIEYVLYLNQTDDIKTILEHCCKH